MNDYSGYENHSTQLQIVRTHLLSGGSITSMEAFLEFWITRLSAIIHILRKKEKLPIETIRKLGNGNKWWGEYRIPPDKLKEARQAASGK